MNRATRRLPSGLFKAKLSWHGDRAEGALSYGYMGNASYCPTATLSQRLIDFFAAGAGKSVFWYVNISIYRNENLRC